MRSSWLLAFVALGLSCTPTTPVAPGPNCSDAETACGQVCAVLRTDDKNCGSCGKACEATQACANSACFEHHCPNEMCGPDQVCFEGQCEDKSCVGVLCPAGQQCAGGLCACAAPNLTCGANCLDPRLDDANCGACAHACGATESCAASTCLPDDCPGEECDPRSVCSMGRCVEKACVGVACGNGLTCVGGACVCPTPSLTCGGSCVDPKRDDANCGSCGHACGSTESCAAATCLPDDCPNQMCDPQSVCSMGQCVERACVGVACGSGQTCVGGTCVCAAPDRQCGGACVNPNTDSANCGMCGRACGGNESCVAGACTPNDCTTADGGVVDCGPVAVCVAGQCVDKACIGISCGQGQTCRAGICSCAAPAMTCGSSCVSFQTDNANCGACGRACGANERCATGACLPTSCGSTACDALSVCYQGSCTEISCIGVSCSNGQVCRAGVCGCPSGTVQCGNACVNTQTSTQNCGACGMPCASGESCVAGQCAAGMCPSGQTLCGNTCVDTRIDRNNCNQCGAACGGNRNCVNSACVCPAGLSLCGSTCVNLATDQANCGVCSRSCGLASCNNSTCTACGSGQTLCGSQCIATTTDNNNCGACNRRCVGGQTCTNSTCACPAGQTFCNNQCIPTDSDNLNCGACGRQCAVDQQCVAGVCGAKFTCQTNFNAWPAACSAIPSPIDPSRCGVVQSTGARTLDTGMGSLAVNQFATSQFTYAPWEQLRITQSLLSLSNNGSSWSTYVATPAGTRYSGDNQVIGNMIATQLSVERTGSIFACSQPTQAVIAIGPGGGMNYSYTAQALPINGRFNTGGATIPDAGVLQTLDGGAVCDQVCSYIANGCPDGSDDRQYYQFTIKPRGAVVMEYSLTAPGNGANMDIAAVSPNGQAICTLVNNFIANQTPAKYRSRMVNNTDVEQTVIVYPWNWGSGSSVRFHMAIAAE